MQLINKYDTGEKGDDYARENKGKKENEKGKSKPIEKVKHDKDLKISRGQ